jgi:hypothetical protein
MAAWLRVAIGAPAAVNLRLVDLMALSRGCESRAAVVVIDCPLLPLAAAQVQRIFYWVGFVGSIGPRSHMRGLSPPCELRAARMTACRPSRTASDVRFSAAISGISDIAVRQSRLPAFHFARDQLVAALTGIRAWFPIDSARVSGGEIFKIRKR